MSNTKGVCSLQYHPDGTKAAVAYRDYAIKVQALIAYRPIYRPKYSKPAASNHRATAVTGI